MSNFKNLKQSLSATMAGIASNAGLKLAFGSPRTNGETVWVTDIPLNPTEDDYHVVLGDLGHEVGHIKYTDFNRDRGNGLLAALVNVFEDVRIERELEREFLGMKHYLDESYKVVMKKGGQRQPDSIANALTLFLLLKYMIDINDRFFFIKDMDISYQALLDFGVIDELLNQIVQLCDSRVAKLASTEDVISLAKDVIALLEQEQKEPDEDKAEDQAAQGTSDSNEDSKENPDDSDGSNSQQETSSEDSNEMEPNDQGSDESSSSSDCAKAAQEILESNVEESSPISLREQAEGVLNNTPIDGSLKELIGETTDLARELKDSNGGFSKRNFYEEQKIVANLPRYLVLKAEISSEINILSRSLIKIWQNKSRTRNILNDLDGRFDIAAGVRCLATGESNYLRKKTKRTDNKPAICLLADLSGSMTGDYINAQTKAIIALAEACDKIKIPLNILGFSDQVISIKKWQDPMVKSRGRIGGMNILSCTNIPPAIYQGLRALNSRKESKKILITLTDGEIGSDEGTVKSILQYAKTYHPNTEFYGLGIGVCLKHVFPKGGQVNSNNMASTILEILNS